MALRLLIFATENTAPIPTIFKNASTAVRQQVTPSKILKIATLYIPIFAERLRSIFFFKNCFPIFLDNHFAHNKDKDDFHPSVVGRVFDENKKCWIIPGTSKDYNKGTNVFRVKINPNDPDCPYSYFLIKLRMTYNSKDLTNLQRGWNGIDSLSDSQIEELKLQIKFSLGINV